MAGNITIWHNSGCSTSRRVLEFLASKEDVSIRNYIADPPSVTELQSVLNAMNKPATYILRTKDKVYKELFSDQKLTDDQWIEAMHKHPSIIERPIVLYGTNAYLARPADDFIANLGN